MARVWCSVPRCLRGSWFWPNCRSLVVLGAGAAAHANPTGAGGGTVHNPLCRHDHRNGGGGGCKRKMQGEKENCGPLHGQEKRLEIALGEDRLKPAQNKIDPRHPPAEAGGKEWPAEAGRTRARFGNITAPTVQSPEPAKRAAQPAQPRQAEFPPPIRESGPKGGTSVAHGVSRGNAVPPMRQAESPPPIRESGPKGGTSIAHGVSRGNAVRRCDRQNPRPPSESPDRRAAHL